MVLCGCQGCRNSQRESTRERCFLCMLWVGLGALSVSPLSSQLSDSAGPPGLRKTPRVQCFLPQACQLVEQGEGPVAVPCPHSSPCPQWGPKLTLLAASGKTGTTFACCGSEGRPVVRGALASRRQDIRWEGALPVAHTQGWERGWCGGFVSPFPAREQGKAASQHR